MQGVGREATFAASCENHRIGGFCVRAIDSRFGETKTQNPKNTKPAGLGRAVSLREGKISD